MAVEFQDFSYQVKAEINETTKAWLKTWANETASQAQRNTSTEGWTNAERTTLRDSYKAEVDENAGIARIGSGLEQAYWEEFGTGEHADTSKNGGKEGRSGWWIYTPDNDDAPEGYDSNEYASEEDAKDMAAYIRAVYDKKAVVTNGREPNYTLEKAFIAVKPKAERDLENKLKGMG